MYQNSPIRTYQSKWTPFLYFQDHWRVSRRAFVFPISHNSVDPNSNSGYMQLWNLNVQREPHWKTVFTGAYIGSKGSEFLVSQNINPAVFVHGQSTANSTYHSLQLSGRRRLSGGFSIPRNQATNPFRQNLGKGRSDFDVRHRVVNIVLCDLPFGRISSGADSRIIQAALKFYF